MRSLRSTDFEEVIARDPDLKREKIPSTPFTSLGDLWVTYKGGPEEVAGYPDLRDILYGDVSGDGEEEAVVLLESGGTAGATGLLVYHATPSGPRIAVAKGGYKMWPGIEGSQLVITMPVYGGWEPNCCPSASETTRYRLNGNQLIAEGSSVHPYEQAKELTVEHFYGLISGRHYQEAYDFLSPAFQKANPYATWEAGFASTERVEVNAREGEGGSVAVELTATDRTSSGATRGRRFQGRWFLIFSLDRRQWLLDRAEIGEVQ